MVQSWFIQLRQFTKIRSSLSFADLEKVIRAFIYLTTAAHFILVSAGEISKLAAAARLLTHTKRSNHITTILAACHWLSVSIRIDFKVFKASNGQALALICDLLTPYVPDHCLR